MMMLWEGVGLKSTSVCYLPFQQQG